MYSRMAEHYEVLFPVGEVKAAFVHKWIPGGGQVLDVGCATGELARWLAATGCTVRALDPDPVMVEQARMRAAAAGLDVIFIAGGFEEVESAAAGVPMDAVTCLGNTLVHADDNEAVAHFLGRCRRVMQPEGRLLLQTVNMDRVERLMQAGFPVREANGIRLERRYLLHEDGKQVWFETTVTDTGTGEVATGRVPLLVLTKPMLDRLLNEAGFRKVRWFGDFRESPWTKASPATIAVAEIGDRRGTT